MCMIILQQNVKSCHSQLHLTFLNVFIMKQDVYSLCLILFQLKTTVATSVLKIKNLTTILELWEEQKQPLHFPVALLPELS